MKTVAVTQSNYIPWKGYFDIFQNCDTVILLDDVQYTKRDWRNRNQIKTAQGLKWLTIPVETKGKHTELRICDVEVKDENWAEKHWNLIEQSYKKAPCFQEVSNILKLAYEQVNAIKKLSGINKMFLEAICGYLNIDTKIVYSTDYFSLEKLDLFSSTERLLKLSQAEEAICYVSGPAAKDYMDISLFEKAGVDVKWADYSNYPEYPQLHGDFAHGVSIIDMLMMLGKETNNYMKGKDLL